MDGPMISFTEAQIMAWVSPIFWPFLRVLAVFASAPIFSSRSVPMRTKIGLAFVIAVCMQPALPEPPMVSLTSSEAFGAIIQQISIGVAAPVLGTVLAVGLVISLFQALTQINEATLSFVPKLVAAVAVFAIAGPWMLVTLVDFMRRTLLSIPDYAV